MKSWLCTLLFLTLCLNATESFSAGVEIAVEKGFDIAAQPLDTVISRDGKYLYMLAPEGKIYVYSTGGKLEGTLDAPAGTEKMVSSPKSDLLYLVGKNRKVNIARIEFIRDIDITGAPAKGPADAPVTIVEFSDYQCPYCARLAPVLEQVLGKYPGKVKLVFKNFPLKMHKFAKNAAIAAHAAESQGKFWPFYEKLFQNFNTLNEDKIREIAGAIGLDMAKFEKDRVSPLVIGQVNKDIAQSNALGISAVPAVFVNGRQVRNRTAEGIGAAVDQALSGGKQKK